ncbi:MAG: FAD:protein FMN transferase [bacterium]
MKEQNGSNILSSLPEQIRNIISNTAAALLILMLLMLLYIGYRSIAARYSGTSEISYAMGTIFEIKVNGVNTGGHVKVALDKVKEISDLINYYDEKSEVSAINNMAGISAVAVSHDTFDMINKALKVCRQTGGTFDITIGPLFDIWNFNAKTHTEVPSGNELIYAQHLVNYNNVMINLRNETIKLLYPGMKISLGGSGKGYAISKARSILVERGIKSAIISAGSSIAVIGSNKGKPWKIGIKDPRRPDETVGVISLVGGQAVSTSGDYEKYFEIGGKRFHHILDPGTDMPADECMSVTIISDDAMQADMLSTAVFVMGPKRGLDLVNSFKNVYAVIIDKDGNVISSPGLNLERQL